LLTKKKLQESNALGTGLSAGLFRTLEAIATHEVKIEGVSTGLPSIDALTGGLRPGKLNLVGGYATNGKTALMASVGVRTMAEDAPFLFISVDDSDDTLLSKLLAMIYDLPMSDVMHKGPKWRKAQVKDLEGQLFIATPQDSSSYTADQVLTIYDMVTDFWGRPPRVACFDYMSLLSTSGDDGGGYNVKDKAQRLKQVARQTLDTVWLVGHQCKKDAGQDCPALNLNHLEYGGHQEADGVVLGCRRNVTTTQLPKWEQELERETPTVNVSVMKNKITGKTSPDPAGTSYVIDPVSGILRPFTADEMRIRDLKGRKVQMGAPVQFNRKD